MIRTERLDLINRDKSHFESILTLDKEKQMAKLGLNSDERYDVEIDRLHRLLLLDESSWKSWDLILRSENTMIGSGGFHSISDRHQRAELGYALDMSHRRKGYMTEAVSAFVDHGFHEMNLNRIEAFIEPSNLASLNLIKRLGFKEEGRLKQHHNYEGQLYDSLVFALLKDEYINK